MFSRAPEPRQRILDCPITESHKIVRRVPWHHRYANAGQDTLQGLVLIIVHYSKYQSHCHLRLDLGQLVSSDGQNIRSHGKMKRGWRKTSYLGEADRTTRRGPPPVLLIGKVKSAATTYIQIEQGWFALFPLITDEVIQIPFFFQGITFTRCKLSPPPVKPGTIERICFTLPERTHHLMGHRPEKRPALPRRARHTAIIIRGLTNERECVFEQLDCLVHPVGFDEDGGFSQHPDRIGVRRFPICQQTFQRLEIHRVDRPETALVMNPLCNVGIVIQKGRQRFEALIEQRPIEGMSRDRHECERDVAPCLPNFIPAKRRVGNPVDGASLAIDVLERIARFGFEIG